MIATADAMSPAHRPARRLWSKGETECLLIERDDAPRFEVRVMRGEDVLRQDRLYARASAEMLAETWQSTLNRETEQAAASAGHELRRRDEAVKMPSDDLLNHHVGVLPRDRVGVEIVLPEVDRAAEMFREKRHEP